MARNQQIMALNKLGIDKFHELIEDRIKGNTNFSVDGIVSNSDYVDLTPFKTVIDLDKKFEDRYHLAKYLYETLVNEYSENRGEYGMDNRDEHGKSVGLWSWFALVYFEQLYEYSSKGNAVRDHAHFVFAPHEGYRWYRHSVFTSFYLVENYPKLARVFISSKISTHGQIIESAVSRNYLMSSKVVTELLYKLYADTNNNGVAKEKASSQPETNKLRQLKKNGKAKMQGYGGIERFTKVIQRLKLTYHVQDLDSDTLLDLMGDEFRQWVDSH